MNDTDDRTLLPGPNSGPGADLPARTTKLEFERLQLLSRFVAGALLYGSSELMNQLRELQHEYEADPVPVEPVGSLDGKSSADLGRYLAVGLFTRGQRGVARGVRTSFYASLGAASWVVEKIDRATDNRVMRPLRKPIRARLSRMAQETRALVREGQFEEEQSRQLAGDAIGEIVEQVVDRLADNPEFHRAIREIIGKQSLGMAAVVEDNTRQLTSSADDVAERIVRRLLRRTPRAQLPPSPLAGKPQNMYAPQAEQGRNDDEK